MTMWFISDTHFGSPDVLKFTNKDGSQMRPFYYVSEMDEKMVDNWNRVVRDKDHVWHLGDVGNASIIHRLKGIKGLVMGNHDPKSVKYYLGAGFKKIASYRVYDHMLFSHIPIHPGSMGPFHANVHGHTHGNSYPLPYVNVSVEAINYTPITLEQIKSKLGI